MFRLPINQDKLKNILKVPADRAEQRLDNFLLARFRKVSRPRLYKMLRKGEIRVNKGRNKPNYRIQTGDKIRLPPALADQYFSNNCAPSVQSIQISKKNSTAELANKAKKIFKDAILYVSDLLIIINKPSGLAVHSGSGLSYGVIELLREYWPRLPQLELVHRLDIETSGCLLVAKKRSMLRELHRLFREKAIFKSYHVLLMGDLKEPCKINLPLKKHELSFGKHLVEVDKVNGSPALTKFIPLQYFVIPLGTEDLIATLAEAQPVTGKTHQIRVHAAKLGVPIAADNRYGDNKFNLAMKYLGLKRLFLHANKLEFKCPKSQQLISVTASYDAALSSVLGTLQNSQG